MFSGVECCVWKKTADDPDDLCSSTVCTFLLSGVNDNNFSERGS
jgi:hypothetical protein